MSDASYQDPEDDTNTDDTPEDTSPAIQTSADQGDDTDPQDDGDQDQPDPNASGGSGPVPGAAQSNGPQMSELVALVRAVSQYGFKMAQQGGGQAPAQAGQAPGQPQQQAPQDQGPPQGQSQGYALGGLVRGYDEGGAIPTQEEPDQDQTGGMQPDQPDQPQPADQGASQPTDSNSPRETTPGEAALNTREQALDRSGLGGGAFGQSQHTKIAAARQELAEKGEAPGTEDRPSQSNPISPDSIRGAVGGMAKQFMDGAANGPVGQAAQGLIKYLKGDGAMDGNTSAAIGYAVDPNGNLPPVQKSMKMVQYAYSKGLQEGDPRTAMQLSLGVLQHQRQQYDMWRTGAAVKLSQGDVGSAIDAANKAFQGPFGENVHFMPSDGGKITATVTGDKGEVQGTFPMQPAQFQQLMQSHGKFDTLVHNGIFDTLSQLSAPTPQQGAAPAQRQQFANAPQSTAGTAKPQTDQERYPILKAPEGTDQKMFDQSKRIFPWVSQNSQREQWIADQQEQQAGRSNKVDIAAAGNNGRNYRAELGAQTRTNINENTQQHQDARADTRESGRQERFDKGWENRTQAALIKAAGAKRDDPAERNKMTVAKSLLTQYAGDPDGFKSALKQYGIDYDRDVLQGGSSPAAGQPQSPGAKQAPPAAAQGAPGNGAAKAGSPGAPPEVGTVKNGYRFKGGNPADRSAWERAQ